MELSGEFLSEKFSIVNIMNLEMAVDVLRQTLTLCLLVIGPVMGVTVIVGVLVSLVQSITSIQEQTLVFVPKLVMAVIAFMVFSNWMILKVMEFTVTQINLIGNIAR